MRFAIIAAGAIVAFTLALPVATAGSSPFASSRCPSGPALEHARCGYLIVPENRNKPNGRTIRLPVAIIPAAAAKPAPDPIVWLTGGPGFDAFTQAQLAVDWRINRDRSVILMSQRGTYSSDPALTCPNLDRFNASSVGMIYDARSTQRLHAQAVATCRRGLAARGIDLSAYNTSASAADYDDLRKTLGFAKWNVWGMSYGTDLALTYVRLYPNAVRAVGIDGVVPPDVAGPAMTWSSLKKGLVDGIFRACAAQAACEKRYPNLTSTFTRLVRRLEARPIATTVKLPESDLPIKVVIDGGVLVNWAVSAANHAGSLPQMLDELAHGHPERIAEQWAADQIGDPKEYGRYSYGLAYSIFCSEWVPYEPSAALVEAGRRAFPAFPESVLVQAPQLPYLRQDCREWNVPKAPSSIRDATRSAIPALVISSTFDTKTGRQWGWHAARTLSNATVVTIPGVGHTVVSASKCAQVVVTSFFDRPVAPDTACVRALKPVRFPSA